MNILRSRCSASVLLIGLLTVQSSGCAPYGDQYGYGGGTGYGLGYYGTSGQSYYGTPQPYYGTSQPYYATSAVSYGGWGSGYAVAPYRGAVHYPVANAGRASPPAYRPAAATHPVPSLPSQSRPAYGNRRGSSTHS
jgi:hypothetical protein